VVIDSAAPAIYVGRQWPELKKLHRFVAALVAVGCVGVLIRAATLVPSPSGVGTHSEMGLAACAFYERTGVPCPGCGMTTSFAWFARGNVAASFYVQPLGFLLAVVTAVCAVGGAYVAITGRALYRLLRIVPSRYYLLPSLLFATAAWGWKIYLQLGHHDGWH
jgi:hypothetical protein